MNLDEFERERKDASVAASNQGRTLAIGGLGLVWLFAADFFLNRTHSKPSAYLAVAGVLLAVCLLLDAAQLFVRWAFLETSFRAAEQREATRTEEPEFEDVGTKVGTWTVSLFVAKFALLLAGYVTLGLYFALRFAR